jgi:hypothetical protein
LTWLRKVCTSLIASAGTAEYGLKTATRSVDEKNFMMPVGEPPADRAKLADDYLDFNSAKLSFYAG